MIAHLGPVPIEEILPALTGAGGVILFARAWAGVRFRRRKEPAT